MNGSSIRDNSTFETAFLTDNDNFLFDEVQFENVLLFATTCNEFAQTFSLSLQIVSTPWYWYHLGLVYIFHKTHTLLTPPSSIPLQHLPRQFPSNPNRPLLSYNESQPRQLSKPKYFKKLPAPLVQLMCLARKENISKPHNYTRLFGGNSNAATRNAVSFSCPKESLDI